MASAHATPLSYFPEASSALDKAPGRIDITFSENIEPNASSITVLGPDGSQVNSGPAVVGQADHHRFTVVIKDGGKGTYLASWQVVSADDGHFTKGAFSFTVGKEGRVGTTNIQNNFQVVHSSQLNESITIWLELLGHMLIAGFLIAAWFLSSRSPKFLLWGIILSVAGGVLYLVVKGFDLASAQNTVFWPAFKNFCTTTAGTFTIYRLLCYGIILAASFWKESKKVLWFIAGAIIVAVYARAKVSHTAASHTLPDFSVFMNFIHLLFKEALIGVVVVFALSILPKIIDAEAKRISSKVSRIAAVCIGVAGVSGVYVVWLHLKSIANATTTDWGMVFLSLTTLAAFLLGFRLYNHYRFSRKVIYMEAFIGMAILFVTSSIIITSPSVSGENFQKSMRSGDANIIFGKYQYGDKMLFTEIDSKAPVDKLTVSATEEEKGIGPIVIDTEKIYEGGYIIPTSGLIDGKWKIEISAHRPGAYDANSQFDLNYPADLAPYSRWHLGTFELANMAMAAFVILLSLFLYRTAGIPAGGIKRGSPVVFALIVIAIISAGTWALADNTYLGLFKKLCVQNGDMWHNMTPMKNSVILSSESVGGCMAKEGTYHFADFREYQYYLQPVNIIVDLIKPSVIKTGEKVPLTFKVANEMGRPVEMTIIHERVLHSIVISEDFSVFSHIHPEDFGSVSPKDKDYKLEYVFPKAGRYLIAFDFTIKGQAHSRQYYVDVLGAPKMGKSVDDMSRDKEFSGYYVKLSSPYLQAGKMSNLKYTVEKDGKPVTDMAPYLAAAMHLAIVKEDLSKFIHAHGEVHPPGQPTPTPTTAHVHLYVPPSFGPDVEAHVIFPEAGTYHIFGQFKHDGKVIVTDFVVEVL